MQNLAEKISEMVAEQGMVKFENSSVFGKAAAYATFKGMIRVYATTPGHTVYTVKVS